MTLLYPIVLETEDNGAVSAYVPGCRFTPRQKAPRRQNVPFVPC